MSEARLDAETIARATTYSKETPLIVALSGGGDSTALLHLLAERIGAARLCAVVVDHALRANSAHEAEAALGFATALGVQGEVVRLSWPDGPKRSQAHARERRYAALCAAAKAKGSAVICVAHTRDDQAETVFLRAVAASTWRGLAGMSAFAPAPVWPEGRDVWLARPLLRARRDELREMLRARRADWIEDPSNQNVAFARVRARRQLAALEASGFDPMRLAELADRLRPFAEALDAEAAALIAHARFDEDTVQIGLSAWTGSGAAARRRALSVLIAAAAGAPTEPRAEAVAALDARIGPEFRGATLGGARLRLRAGALFISRDAGALSGRADGAAGLAPMALTAGTESAWDGRLRVAANEPGWRIEARAGRPVFCKGEASLPWAEAVRCDIVTGEWLMGAHVRHILPVHPKVTGVSA
ncbi:MAG: tRNA lysidine(34) synthetase TilS [Pseudomonadota bacterium]